MRNLPQSLAELEFKDSLLSREEVSFKKILHRHYKNKDFGEIQRKIAEEYQNLREVALEMCEAEAAFHTIMQARQKLVDVYRDLVIKSQSDGST